MYQKYIGLSLLKIHYFICGWNKEQEVKWVNSFT